MRQTVERRRLKGRNASRAIHSLAKHSNIAQLAKHEHKAEQLPGVEGCDHALLFSAIQCLLCFQRKKQSVQNKQEAKRLRCRFGRTRKGLDDAGRSKSSRHAARGQSRDTL